MNFDVAIYRANANDSEQNLNLKAIAILVVNFDNLRLKKIKDVSRFTRMTTIIDGDWTTVLPHIASAINRASGSQCLRAVSSPNKPRDIRLHVAEDRIDTVVSRLSAEMAKSNLVLKRTARV